MTHANKVVLITGASRGIGRALADHLSRPGLQVVITGRNQVLLDEIEAGSHGKILALRADAGNPDDILASVKQVMAQFSRLDVLINNAGTGAVGKRLWECPAEEWWRVQEVNTRGPLLYMHAVLPHMISRGAGTIINLGSYLAIIPSPGASCYAASKAAIAKITDSLALEVKEFGISVYCVSPGLVKTDMTRDLPAVQDLPESAWSSVDRICQKVLALMGDKYTGLSGRFLHVDDDLDILIKRLDEVTTRNLYQLSLNRFSQD